MVLLYVDTGKNLIFSLKNSLKTLSNSHYTCINLQSIKTIHYVCNIIDVFICNRLGSSIEKLFLRHQRKTFFVLFFLRFKALRFYHNFQQKRKKIKRIFKRDTLCFFFSLIFRSKIAIVSAWADLTPKLLIGSPYSRASISSD